MTWLLTIVFPLLTIAAGLGIMVLYSMNRVLRDTVDDLRYRISDQVVTAAIGCAHPHLEAVESAVDPSKIVAYWCPQCQASLLPEEAPAPLTA